MKAPYWFVAEGRGFRLLERGEPTSVSYSTMEEAKRNVLSLNDKWRVGHPKKAKKTKAKRSKT